MKVISYENIPASLNLDFYLVLWLFLDKVNAPELWYGIFYCFTFLGLLASFIKLFKQQTEDIFKK